MSVVEGTPLNRFSMTTSGGSIQVGLHSQAYWELLFVNSHAFSRFLDKPKRIRVNGRLVTPTHG